jgi:hypothetical protein
MIYFQTTNIIRKNLNDEHQVQISVRIMMSILFVFDHLIFIIDRLIASIESRQKQQQILVISISEEKILSKQNHHLKNSKR